MLIKLEQFIATAAIKLGNKLMLWGSTHYPFVLTDDTGEEFVITVTKDAYTKA